MAMSEPETGHKHEEKFEQQPARPDADDGLGAGDIDWLQLYVDEAGGPREQIDAAKRKIALSNVYDIGFDEAEELVQEAVGEGFLVRDEGSIVTSKELAADFSGIEAASAESGVDDGAEDGLFDSADLDAAGTPAQAIIEKQNEIIEEQQQVIDQLENRMGDLEGRMDAHQRQINTERDLRRGVTELQVRELQNGAMLGREQVNVDALTKELGLKVEFVGDGDEYVRLANPDNEGDNKNVSHDMPRADEMCQVEQWRQMWRRGLMDRDNLKDGERRAMLIWNELEKIAQKMDGGDRYEVESRKAKIVLSDEGELDNLSGDSKNTATNRAMKELANQHATGIVDVGKNGNKLVLQFDKDVLQEVKKPLYAGKEAEGGKILVNR